MTPITHTTILDNYPPARENINFIKEYVAEQVELDRMTGPYSARAVERILGGPFVSSPLSVVPKAGGKLRLVQDCSREDADGLSVNGRIDANDFPTTWGTAAKVAELVSPGPVPRICRAAGCGSDAVSGYPWARESSRRQIRIGRSHAVAQVFARQAHDACVPRVAPRAMRAALGASDNARVSAREARRGCSAAMLMNSQVASAPPGTQMAILDIDSAFRNIPVVPEHKPYLVIQCEDGQFFIDHVVPFGVTSGVGLQGSVMDALVACLNKLGMGPNEKWVDDLANFRYPIGSISPGVWVYGHDVGDIFALSLILRVPWSITKTFIHAYTAVYSGFLWNLPDKTVELPEEKRAKYLERVETALRDLAGGKPRMLCKDAMKLNGTLTHISFVYPQGRAYLTGLSHFIAGFGPDPSRFKPRYPPKSMIADLRWWRNVLSQPGIKRLLRPRGEARDPDLWVDASSDWGIGLVVGWHYAAWRWSVPQSVWKKDGREIGWAEMVAVELATRWMEQEAFQDCEVLVRSDNTGVVGAIDSGRSRNWQANLVLRRHELICMTRNVVLKMEWVDSASNRADPVSCGVPDARFDGKLDIRFDLPPELAEFLALDHA